MSKHIRRCVPVIWVRQELFQQRVCPAIDIDLLQVYQIIEGLRLHAVDDWFTLEVWLQICADVVGLNAMNAQALFQGYKIMESWGNFSNDFHTDSVGMQTGGTWSRGRVSLMAQFLFVRNFDTQPITNVANLKLQHGTVYPNNRSKHITHSHLTSIANSSSPSGNSRKLSASSLHSWSSTMKLRQSSADQHCKFILTYLTSLLRLTISNLADKPEDLEQAVVSSYEMQSFNFLFGACTEQDPNHDISLLRLFQLSHSQNSAKSSASDAVTTAKKFEDWLIEHLVSIPYWENIQDVHGSPNWSNGPNSPSPRSSPHLAAQKRPLYVANRSDSSVFIDEHHFPVLTSTSTSNSNDNGKYSCNSSESTGHGECNDNSSVHGRSVTVFQCSHTSVFVVAPVAFLRVVGCSNCVIFVSVARFNVTVENCDHCDITATSRSVVICNCVDSTLNICSTTNPVLSGDCRGIRLAPNGSFHHQDLTFLSHVQFPGMSHSSGTQIINATRISPKVCNLWDKPIEDEDPTVDRVHSRTKSGAKTRHKTRAHWALLSPDEFSPVLVPYSDDEAQAAVAKNISLYPAWRRLPEPYASVKLNRLKQSQQLQSEIESLGCSEDEVKHLKTFVENEFMEWLHTQGHSIELHNWAKKLRKGPK